MTALHKLAHRHAYLNRPEVATASACLSIAFAHAAAPFRAPGMLGAGILGGVELDLIYALLRHRLWAQTPLFATVLIDHLATSFQLPRPVAESLTCALLPTVRQHTTAQSLISDVSDQGFLRYICVASASALDEAALLLDLGLGQGLLTRIKAALLLLTTGAGQSDDDLNEGAPKRQFIGELDAQITEVVCALSLELRSCPWVLQQERLRYLLATIADPWLSVLRDQGVAWLFELLLAIASRKTMNTRQIALLLRASFPDERGFLQESSVAILCQELSRHHLLSLERGHSIWRTLPLAEELTADAYAMQTLSDKAPVLSELTDLNASFQATMIRAMDLSAHDTIQIIHTLRPLTPLGLKAALMRLAQLDPKEHLPCVLESLMANEPSIWLRRVANDLAITLGIAPELGPVARLGHDESPRPI